MQLQYFSSHICYEKTIMHLNFLWFQETFAQGFYEIRIKISLSGTKNIY